MIVDVNRFRRTPQYVAAPNRSPDAAKRHKPRYACCRSDAATTRMVARFVWRQANAIALRSTPPHQPCSSLSVSILHDDKIDAFSSSIADTFCFVMLRLFFR
jgi:hypothetical protein